LAPACALQALADAPTAADSHSAPALLAPCSALQALADADVAPASCPAWCTTMLHIMLHVYHAPPHFFMQHALA
jgi:hypothetical protein